MMNSPRTWHLFAVLAAVVILALGWVLGASPLLGQAAAADQSRAQVEQQNQQQRALLVSMQGQYRDLDKLKAKMAALQLSVPGTADLDDFFDQVAAGAAATGASISSITAGEARPYGTSSSSTGGASSAPQPAPTATAAPSASPAAPAPSPTPAAPGTVTGKAPTGDLASKLFVVPIDITLTSGMDQMVAFVDRLQRGPRLMLVDSMTVTASPAGGTISGYVFVVHDAGPTSSPSSSPSPLPSATPTATPAPTPTK